MGNTTDNLKTGKLNYNTSRSNVEETEVGLRAYIADDSQDTVAERLFAADRFQHQFG